MQRTSFFNSTSPKDERLENLKRDYPELIKDGRVDVNALRDFIGEEGFNESDLGYGLYWPGKREAKIMARKPAEGTLEPVVGDGVNEDTTKNLYIEGDNLEVLRILKNSYKGRVKMIYIDPPYNTGNDFVYKDNFHEPVDDYLKATGQMDENGTVLVSNPKSNGAFHRSWLNMMYARLQLARELLAKDGVIFISIDDNELTNLKLICDEIFGEENFVNNFAWVNKPEGRQISGSGAAGTHEYILLYAKNIETQGVFSLNVDWLKQVMPGSYKGFKFDIKSDAFGEYIATHELFNGNSKFNEETRPSLVFDVYYREVDGDIQIEDVSSQHIHPGYVKIPPHRNTDGVHKYHAYRWSKKKILSEPYNLEFIKNGDSYKILSKRRNFNRAAVRDLITDMNTTAGAKDLKKLNIVGFDYPKSVGLISLLIKMCFAEPDEEFDSEEMLSRKESKSEIILDFFSGSSTTAHAVMSFNVEEGSNHRFIMVQLPVVCGEKTKAHQSGYENICEIGKERIRRAGKEILKEHPELKNSLDVGFKVYRESKSNIEPYKSTKGNSKEALMDLFENLEKQVTPLRDGWTKEGLLTEVMLRQGYALDSVVTTLPEFKKNDVVSVKDEKIEGKLIVCFDEKIKTETIKSLQLDDADIFICLDSAIDDEHYSQLSDKGRIATV